MQGTSRAIVSAAHFNVRRIESHMGLIDDSEAGDYIGKTVLVGMTYLNKKGELREQKQFFGTITVFSRAAGIKIKLRNTDDLFSLPPDSRGLQKAKPGTYRLRSTGEVITDPDYVSTWTVNERHPETVPNQSTDPTLASGPPLAGPESRHP